MSVSRALFGALKYRRYNSFPSSTTLRLTGSHRPPHALSKQPLLALTTKGDVQIHTYSTRNFESYCASQAQHKDGNEEGQVLPKDGSILETTAAEDSTPWYLRVQDAEVYENTLLERQRLPDIPEDAPTQLNDIINHLSEGIGLEYLTLMDLRELDPPPALGSNLIMIVGTARSTRHLNVSADRFCRWLRSTYKLSPHADGLLGRNELKLKLRRRARRAKILGSKLRPSDGDDGITTGWICVNVGILGNGATGDQLVRNKEGSVVGFGQDNQGTNIVVQLLTEEKRESLDLEGLWTKYLERQRGRLARLESDAEPDNLDGQPALSPQDTLEARRVLEDDTTNFYPSVANEQSSTLVGQRRSFHSTTKQCSRPRPPSPSLAGPEQSRRHFSTGGRLFLTVKSEPSNSINTQRQLEYISTLPSHEAITALGTGWEDRTSTPFLASFFAEVGPSPTVDHYRARLALMQLAIEMQHPNYGVSGLLGTLEDACESLITVPEDFFELAIDNVANHRPSDIPNERNKHPGAEQLFTLLNLLEDMSLRGLNFYNQALVETLFDMILKMKQEDPRSAAKYLDTHPLAHIAVLADEHQCSLSGSSRCLAALEDLIRSRNWNGVWRVWAWFPIREERRPPDMYAAVFRFMAESKHQTACMEALTKMTPTMELEDPPVDLEGDTAVAMLECLKVADPGVQMRYERGEMERRPWVQLFQACVEGLQASNTIEEKPAM